MDTVLVFDNHFVSINSVIIFFLSVHCPVFLCFFICNNCCLVCVIC